MEEGDGRLWGKGCRELKMRSIGKNGTRTPVHPPSLTLTLVLQATPFTERGRVWSCCDRWIVPMAETWYEQIASHWVQNARLLARATCTLIATSYLPCVTIFTRHNSTDVASSSSCLPQSVHSFNTSLDADSSGRATLLDSVIVVSFSFPVN